MPVTEPIAERPYHRLRGLSLSFLKRLAKSELFDCRPDLPTSNSRLSLNSDKWAHEDPMITAIMKRWEREEEEPGLMARANALECSTWASEASLVERVDRAWSREAGVQACSDAELVAVSSWQIAIRTSTLPEGSELQDRVLQCTRKAWELLEQVEQQEWPDGVVPEALTSCLYKASEAGVEYLDDLHSLHTRRAEHMSLVHCLTVTVIGIPVLVLIAPILVFYRVLDFVQDKGIRTREPQVCHDIRAQLEYVNEMIQGGAYKLPPPGDQNTRQSAEQRLRYEELRVEGARARDVDPATDYTDSNSRECMAYAYEKESLSLEESPGDTTDEAQALSLKLLFPIVMMAPPPPPDEERDVEDSPPPEPEYVGDRKRKLSSIFEEESSMSEESETQLLVGAVIKVQAICEPPPRGVMEIVPLTQSPRRYPSEELRGVSSFFSEESRLSNAKVCSPARQCLQEITLSV